MDGAFSEAADQKAECASLEVAIGLFDTPAFVLCVVEGTPRQFRFAAINPAYERDVGVVSDALVGLVLDQALPKRQAQTVQLNYDRCLAAGEGITYEEMLQFGEVERWWLTTLTPHSGNNGKVTHLIGITRDITDRKTQEQAQAFELAELGALNGELRTLTAMAAHDLRGPLGTMESLLDLIKEDFVDMGDGKVDLMEAGLDLIQSLRPQIDAVLQRAMSLDQRDPPRQRVELDHVCADLAALIDPNGHLTITYPSLALQADLIAVQLILRNLFDNAARYARSRIMVEAVRIPGGAVEITVADDGPGLDVAQLAEEPRNGHGFGLSAVRHMIQSRGGELRLEGHGILGGLSTHFTLPDALA